MKRYRAPKQKPGVLRMFYGRVDGDRPDVCYQWGGAGANKCDSHLLHNVIGSKRLELVYGEEREKTGSPYRWGPSLIEELEARGYDISTLKFSIEQKRPSQPGDTP
jgi:hypothetical protein